MRDKNWRQEPGGRRDDTGDHDLSRSWKVKVYEKKKKKHNEEPGPKSIRMVYFATESVMGRVRKR